MNGFDDSLDSLVDHTRPVSFWIALLVIAGSVYTAQAQQDDNFAEARTFLQEGHYEDARQLLRDHLRESSFEQRQLVLDYGHTFLAVGDYREGLELITEHLDNHSRHPYLLHVKGRLHEALGAYSEAEEAYTTAREEAPDFWRNLLALSELYEATGRDSRARQLQIRIYRQYQQGQFRTAETLGIAARAAAALEQFHEANEAFRTATERDPSNLQNFYWWAELFRQKYNTTDAERTYRDVLSSNSRHPDAYVGLAHSTRNFPEKEEFARRALDINPNHVGALNVLAELRILDGQYREASSFANEALKINSSSITALAHLASIHHLEGDSTAFEDVEQRAMDINPRAGDFYLTIVDNIVRRFRYPEAITFARRAVEVENDNWRAHGELGTSLLRMGQTDEAQRHLETSFDRDPFNLFVGNTLTLLDEREQFAVHESENFRLLLHASESQVLGSAILSWAEICYDSLSTRYPYTPSGKIQLEAYNDADDFAVRVAGVPHVGLLGVSFGDVVALSTPAARSDRSFNWTRMLWHEIAHTMAIGVSQHHVPRWFTEGLSVYEEQRARARWGREMDLKFYSAFDQNRLLPLEEIDKGFTRPQFPGHVQLSYYHASKVIEHIVDEHGFEAVIDLLTTLGEGHSIDDAVEQTLDRSLSTLDEEFRESVVQNRNRFERALDDLPNILDGRPAQGAWLEKSADGGENPFLGQLREGYRALDREEYAAAETAFREALEIYPHYIGSRNPYEGLAEVYRHQDDDEQLIEILERFLKISEYGAKESRELAELYSEHSRPERAIEYLERSLEVDPYNRGTRAELAQLYRQSEQFDRAVAEREAVLALDPVNRAEALYQLAVDLYMTNDVRTAKDTVVRALEIAPGYSDAQQLLLKCVSTEE